MRVRIWNAYASNNSGSYTIVGTLPSAKVARDVVDAARAMIEAHTAWRDAGGEGSDSPLAAFCRTHGLVWSYDLFGADPWPDDNEDNRPRVAALGNQVIVHHPWTTSLPPTFGDFFEKMGGTVEQEMNHAHNPIVTIAMFSWENVQRAQMEIERLVAALTAADGVLANTPSRPWPAAWRARGQDSEDAPLTVGAVFEDLIDGVSALQAAGERHGAQMLVRVHEVPDDADDPLAYLRPSSPPPAVPRFDVVVTDADETPELLTAISEALGSYHWPLDLPCTLARGLPAPRAEALAAALRRAGVAVELVRNDG